MEDYVWDFMFALILAFVGAMIFSFYSENTPSQETLLEVEGYLKDDIALVDFLRIPVDGGKLREFDSVPDERLANMDMADVIILWPNYKRYGKEKWFGLLETGVIEKFAGERHMYVLSVEYPGEEKMTFSKSGVCGEKIHDEIYLPYPRGNSKIKVVLDIC